VQGPSRWSGAAAGLIFLASLKQFVAKRGIPQKIIVEKQKKREKQKQRREGKEIEGSGVLLQRGTDGTHYPEEYRPIARHTCGSDAGRRAKGKHEKAKGRETVDIQRLFQIPLLSTEAT